MTSTGQDGQGLNLSHSRSPPAVSKLDALETRKKKRTNHIRNNIVEMLVEQMDLDENNIIQMDLELLHTTYNRWTTHCLKRPMQRGRKRRCEKRYQSVRKIVDEIIPHVQETLHNGKLVYTQDMLVSDHSNPESILGFPNFNGKEINVPRAAPYLKALSLVVGDQPARISKK